MSLTPNSLLPDASREIIWKVDKEGNLRAYHSSDLQTPVVWAPQPGSQQDFMRCPVYELLYEGTRGPGKTDAMLMDYAQFVGQGFKADWRGIIFRKTFPELKDIIAKSQKWFTQIFPTATYNKAEHTWTFEDGEVLIFAFMEREEHYWRYHGHAYAFIGWEELTNWPDDTLFKRMMSTNRSTNKNVPLRIRATCNPHGCVPYGDVLTVNGWVDIKEVKVGEEVISVDEIGNLVAKRVSQVHEYDFDGELVVRKDGWTEMAFTPNHRLPLLNVARTKHRLLPYEDLPNHPKIRKCGNVGSWKGVGPPLTRVVPEVDLETRYNVPSLSILDYAELLGWMASEGCVVASHKSYFLLAQSKGPTTKEIHTLLTRCGFKYRYDGTQFWISEKNWRHHFAKLGKCRQKHLPRWFLNQPCYVLEACYRTLMLGDGNKHNYYTTSVQLCDDVCELLTKIGVPATLSSRQREARGGLSYQINALHSRKVCAIRKVGKLKNVESEKFVGKVFCLSVPGTETFFIRQGPTVWLSGNSGHNWVKARYGLPSPPGKSTTALKQPEGLPARIAIHGTIHENKILLHAQPDYISILEESCSTPAEKEAWIHGSWDITSGGMFDDIWNPAHHVLTGLKPEMIPLKWRLDRSYDHGQSKPFSVGWWAQSNGEALTMPNGRVVGQVKGDLIRIEEWYGWDGTPDKGLRMTAEEIALGIREKQREMGNDRRVHPGVADGSIFDEWEPGKSVAGDMRKKRVRWTRADKGPGSRHQGWQQIRKMLKNAIPKKMEDGNHFRESPGLFVSDLCEQFLRTFPVLSRDPKDPDDVDTKIEDHIADEVRYRCRAKRPAFTMARKG